MIAFPRLLCKPALRAGILVPKNQDNYDPDDYPHWHLFLTAQLGQPMPCWNVQWDNAKVVAGLTIEQVKTVTLIGLKRRGFQIGLPIP